MNNAQHIEAIRREAFIQGWLAMNCTSRGTTVPNDKPDNLLAMLPFAEDAYEAWRKTRVP